MAARSCYFQGCGALGITKEHIPPRSFFPDGKRDQLLTVRSCEAHNNAKSGDDLYVLAHICLNASPANESRKVFMEKVAPQLGFNGQALRKTLAADAVQLEGGAVAYRVDTSRVDRFFTALSFGLVRKSCGESLPTRYRVGHIYHDLVEEDLSAEESSFRKSLLSFYDGNSTDLLTVLDFGGVRTLNEAIYIASIFGVPNFGSSITITHKFFGCFRVTSMLTNFVEDADLAV